MKILLIGQLGYQSSRKQVKISKIWFSSGCWSSSFATLFGKYKTLFISPSKKISSPSPKDSYNPSEHLSSIAGNG